jgi:hypothetical protein
MRRNLILNTLAVSLLIGTAALADTIPYPYPEIPNPVSYTFTATATGDVTAYLYGSSAFYDDQIYMVDTTTGQSSLSLTSGGTVDNHTYAGIAINFGSVTVGDTLVFYEIINTAGIIDNAYPSSPSVVSSNPGSNPDNVNYVYATTYTGGTAPYTSNFIPSGVYIGFEDLPYPSTNGEYTYDYADDDIVVTDVTGTPVPEPGTIALLSIGMFGLAVFGKRRMGKKA